MRIANDRKMEAMTGETELLFWWFCVGGYPSQALWVYRQGW